MRVWNGREGKEGGGERVKQNCRKARGYALRFYIYISSAIVRLLGKYEVYLKSKSHIYNTVEKYI